MADQMARMRELISSEKKNLSPSVTNRPYIITVTSGKGGVGKSTIALNIAAILSEYGNKVLLIDGNINLGNLNVMVGVSPTQFLSNVIEGEKDLEDILITLNPKLKLVPSNSGGPNYITMSQEKQKNLFQVLYSLEETFEYVVIDSAAGISAEIIGFALNADETIVVTSAETTAVMDTYAVIKVLVMNRYKNGIGVIVNNVLYPSDADEAVKKLEIAVDHFLKHDIFYYGSIPVDEHIKNSIIDQKILAYQYPSSAAALSLQTIVQKIMSNNKQSVERKPVFYE